MELQVFMDESPLKAKVPGEKKVKDLSFSLDPDRPGTLNWKGKGWLHPEDSALLEGSN